MLPAYLLTIDIIASTSTIDEKQFHEIVDPCLSHLDRLKRAFDRIPCKKSYSPPFGENDKSDDRWSVRGVVMISTGKTRGEYLLELYQSIAHLIMLELPDFEVKASINKLDFS